MTAPGSRILDIPRPIPNEERLWMFSRTAVSVFSLLNRKLEQGELRGISPYYLEAIEVFKQEINNNPEIHQVLGRTHNLVPSREVTEGEGVVTTGDMVAVATKCIDEVLVENPSCLVETTGALFEIATTIADETELGQRSEF